MARSKERQVTPRNSGTRQPGLRRELRLMGDQALAAARLMAAATTRQKNRALQAMAEAITAAQAEITAANRRDLEAGREAGLSAAMLDRLALTPARIAAMVEGIVAIAALPDPVGQRLSRSVRPNGLVIVKRRVPIGVIAIIYESRPNVTADAAALCIKTGNVVILRGGKEALHSNQAVAAALERGLEAAGLPPTAVQLVKTTDRAAVRTLVRMDDRIDLAIPRGGEALIRAVAEAARVPVIKHYKGVCHLYVDRAADLTMALKLTENAKCQRPGVCNALETLLVHAEVAAKFLPRLAKLMQRRGVEVRADAAARNRVPDFAAATAADWDAEYLDLTLALRIVPDLATAIDHINRHGSRHSDAIVTADAQAARTFLRDVDSACVYVNASTRFTDGGEFGMGAEMGISTDKLHARGPMGLVELTTYKYEVEGSGQLRT